MSENAASEVIEIGGGASSATPLSGSRGRKLTRGGSGPRSDSVGALRLHSHQNAPATPDSPPPQHPPPAGSHAGADDSGVSDSPGGSYSGVLGSPSSAKRMLRRAHTEWTPLNNNNNSAAAAADENMAAVRTPRQLASMSQLGEDPSSPVPTTHALSLKVRTPVTAANAFRQKKRGKAKPAAPSTPMIDRKQEARRWDDVIKMREKLGLKSPLTISVNPLRLMDPSQVKELTGSAPTFDVLLEDQFAATPVRQHQRRTLDSSARRVRESLSFQCDGELSLPAVELLESGRVVLAEHAPRRMDLARSTKALVASSSTTKKKARRKKLMGRASTFSAGTTNAVADAPLEVEVAAGERTPSWGSVQGLVYWVVTEGSEEDRLVLALTYRHVLKASALEKLLGELFVHDLSADKRTRRGVLAFIEQWARVMKFLAPVEQRDALLGNLCSFVRNTADMYDKMVAQRNAQAPHYAGARDVLRVLVAVREGSEAAFQQRAAHDAPLYWCGAKLRQDADAVALLAARTAWVCSSVTESLPLAAAQPAVAVLASTSMLDLTKLAGGGPSAALLKMDVRKLAHAVCHVDAALFAAISGFDLLRGPRNGPAVVPKKGGALHVNGIVNITSHWNTLSRWVPTCMLREPSLKMRAKLIKFFLRLALEVKALHNWSGLFALMIGLGSGTVTALKETWRLVRPSWVSTFQELEELCQPICNFKSYRTAISQCMEEGRYCVPYVAIVLKDFQAIEEGNPSKDKRGWLNFSKMQLLASVMRQVRAMQSVECPFRVADKKTVQFISTIECMSEAELWELSKTVKAQEMAAVTQQRTPRW